MTRYLVVAFQVLMGCSASSSPGLPPPRPASSSATAPSTLPPGPFDAVSEAYSSTPFTSAPKRKRAAVGAATSASPKMCGTPKALAVLINGRTAVLEWCDEEVRESQDGGVK